MWKIKLLEDVLDDRFVDLAVLNVPADLLHPEADVAILVRAYFEIPLTSPWEFRQSLKEISSDPLSLNAEVSP